MFKKSLLVKSVLGVLILIGSIASTPALADDKKSFEGFYIGTEFGIVSTNHPAGTGEKVNGFSYGVIGGFKVRPKGKLVLGLEGGYGKSSLKAAANIPEGAAVWKARGLFFLEAILGVAVSENVLIFVTGGLTKATIREHIDGVFDEDFTDTVGRFGGGIEVKITKLVSLRLKIVKNGFQQDNVMTYGTTLIFNF